MLLLKLVFLFTVIATCATLVGAQGSTASSKKRLLYQTAPSRGKILPKPQVQTGNTPESPYFTLNPKNFRFMLDPDAYACNIVFKATIRYFERTFPFPPFAPSVAPFHNDVLYGGEIDHVQIKMLNSNCSGYPEMNMEEQYEIKIDSPDEPGVARIIGASVWGVLRGLESFSQLVQAFFDGRGHNWYMIRQTSVFDFPRFVHRGALLDTSRHFLPMEVIYANLDLMEMNKYNVFHWHVSDDNSFPMESVTFPELSNNGSFTKRHVYSQQNVNDIIEAARLRGIRVVPEFDTPGHTLSWGKGIPGILTKCNTLKVSNAYTVPYEFGPFNPIEEKVYDVVKKFFSEVMSLFPDAVIHLGGDEVSKDCWASNEEIVAYMKDHNITDFNKMESLYIEKLLDIVSRFRPLKTPAVWQEVFDNNDTISKEVVVHVWKEGWQNTIKKVTSAGHRAIISSPWYLNYVTTGPDWMKFYQVEPQGFGGDEEEQKLVIGGEACLWGEWINANNLIPTFWPRASAVAERLWSSKNTTDLDDAAARLQEHACRMTARGFPIGPSNGPGYCDF